MMKCEAMDIKRVKATSMKKEGTVLLGKNKALFENKANRKQGIII